MRLADTSRQLVVDDSGIGVIDRDVKGVGIKGVVHLGRLGLLVDLLLLASLVRQLDPEVGHTGREGRESLRQRVNSDLKQRREDGPQLLGSEGGRVQRQRKHGAEGVLTVSFQEAEGDND